MKKLFAPALMIAGLVLGTAASYANERSSENSGDRHPNKEKAAFYEKNKTEIRNFKTVVKTFYTANGQFLNLPTEKQNEFINSAEILKEELSQKENEKAEKLLKKVDLTENIFRFVWDSKPEYVEPEFSFEAPELTK